MIELEQLSFAYPGNRPVLDGFDLRLRPGEFTGLIGANGSGKSTILNLACGYLAPDRGTVKIKGINLRNRRAKERARIMAVLPQLPGSDFPFTVREMVKMGRIAHLGRLQWWRKADTDAVDQALADLQLSDAGARRFNELSGGERQRVMLAAALAQEPEIMLLDEPTSALDLGYKVKLMNKLGALAAERGITVVVSSHDLELLSRFVGRLVLLKAGRIIADGKAAEVVRPDLIKASFDCKVSIVTGANGEPLISFAD
jgi:iron complex transport system ATP-binding protein